MPHVGVCFLPFAFAPSDGLGTGQFWPRPKPSPKAVCIYIYMPSQKAFGRSWRSLTARDQVVNSKRSVTRTHIRWHVFLSCSVVQFVENSCLGNGRLRTSPLASSGPQRFVRFSPSLVVSSFDPPPFLWKWLPHITRCEPLESGLAFLNYSC